MVSEVVDVWFVVSGGWTNGWHASHKLQATTHKPHEPHKRRRIALKKYQPSMDDVLYELS